MSEALLMRLETKPCHRYEDLIQLFQQCFGEQYHTQLVKGGDEPLYRPADESCAFHRIFFAHGFYSSALHECAHWFIAGAARRQLLDFGYWYEPDGRTPEQQALFQKMEVKPQAIEWILSVAAGFKFQVSLDNLNGDTFGVDDFKQALYQQVLFYCQQGLPSRAAQFRQALSRFYGTSSWLSATQFHEL